MKKLVFIVSLLFSYIASSQDSIPSTHVNKLNTNYKDFEIINNEIYAITNGDSLVVWNTKKDAIKILRNNVTAIAKNSNNILYCTTTENDILYYNLNNKWEKYNSYEGKAFEIFITKDNKPIVIHNKGVFYDKKIYQPEPSVIYRPKRNSESGIMFLRKPHVTYLDAKNRIWLTYDNGEWGTEIWFFDLKTKSFFEEEFLDIEVSYNRFEKDNWERYRSEVISAFPKKIMIIKSDTLYKFPAELPIYRGIKGITEDSKGNIYLSQSLMHFDINGGIEKMEVTNFKDFYKYVSLEHLLDDEVETVEFEDKNGNINSHQYLAGKEYLGTINYNSFNNSIYYYTNNGFFKIIETKNEYSKKLIIKLNLTWLYGLSNSVGYQMAVKKFEFIDKTRFIFLTNANGIGYYDGKQVKYYK